MNSKKDKGDGDFATRAISGSAEGGAVKEYSYVFRLVHEEQRIFNWYRDQIATASTGFAEIYYEYLFDNPDIADVLYADERRGENIGQRVRDQVACLLGFLSREPEPEQLYRLRIAGGRYYKQGFKPVWIIGTHNLYIDHLESLVPALKLTPGDTRTLMSVLTRLLLRNLGLVLEGYWWAASNAADREEMKGAADEVLSGLPGMYWSVDTANNRVIFADESMQCIYGQEMDAPLPCLQDIHEEDSQKILAAWADAAGGRVVHADVRMSLDAGEIHWFRAGFYPVAGDAGRTLRVNCVLESIARPDRDRDDRVIPVSEDDRLAGRTRWNENLKYALALSKRMPDMEVCVVVIGIDQFEMYRESLGNDAADCLLHEFAGRIEKMVRETDSLVRLDTDRFGILLQPAPEARAGALRVIKQLLESMKLPFVSGEKQLYVDIFLGASSYPGDGENQEALLGNAESAMHDARRSARAYGFYESGVRRDAMKSSCDSSSIEVALNNNEFELHFQPLVDLQTSSLLGAEALLRWEHPSDGIVMPDRIIPLAEQSGMIASITDWVFLTALLHSRQWTGSGKPIPVSVNVSACTFLDPRFPESIRRTIAESGMAPGRLQIEITETTLMQDVERTRGILDKLRTTGVGVAIDDFGSHQSALASLEKLPLDTLKISPSLVARLLTGRKETAVVQSMIELGHTLGCKVIAKGVENGDTWNLLGELGCDAAQGFHISKPLPGGHFTDWISAATSSV